TSDWEITSPFQFLHLVLPDEPLRAWFSRIHDRDARAFELTEILYKDAPAVSVPLARLVQYFGQFEGSGITIMNPGKPCPQRFIRKNEV
ncbi:MAG: hypothetical protein AAGB04_19965, partial [Pseudomonadota bacterium]